MRPTAAFIHATANTSGLGDTLLVHKSRLEREREAALEAAPKIAGPPRVRVSVLQL